MKLGYLFTSLIALCCCTAYAQVEEWVQKASMPEGRHHPVTFGFDSVGYVVTGTNTLDAPTRDFYRYDPATDTWTTLPDFPGTQRSFSIGMVYNGKGYMGFGASSFQYLNDIWEFDPATETWQPLTSCPCAGRRHPAFVIRDDRLFVGLGDGASGNLNDWWEYNMVTDTWTQHPNLPGLVRHHPFQFRAGDHVYAGLGHGNLGIYRDWYEFDINTNTWNQMTDFPSEARVAGTQFDYDGFGYVLSGDGDDHSTMQEGEFWKYDHENDTWEELDPHPGVSRWAPGSFVIQNTVYFMAGQNRQIGANLGDMWAYEFMVEDTQVISSNGELLAESKQRVYPNPVVDQLQLVGFDPSASIQIFDLTGRAVWMREVATPVVSMEALRPGTYFVRITEPNGAIFQQKLVKR